MKLLSLTILAAALVLSASMFTVEAFANHATKVRIDHKEQNPKVVIWHKYPRPRGKMRRTGRNYLIPCSKVLKHVWHSNARELTTLQAALKTCERDLHRNVELTCGRLWLKHELHKDWAEDRSIKKARKTCREAGS